MTQFYVFQSAIKPTLAKSIEWTHPVKKDSVLQGEDSPLIDGTVCSEKRAMQYSPQLERFSSSDSKIK